jgi:sugar phosphate isomerase/epimerase
MSISLGLSSYSLTWAVGVPGSIPRKPLSAYDLVDRTSASGLKTVQIADNLPLERLTPAQLSGLYEYARGKNVVIEMGGRGLTTEHTMQCLEAAALLHSPFLRMVIDGQGYEPPMERVKSIIKDLRPEFKKRNIRLAIENHDRFKTREFEDLIVSAGSDWTGICLDSVNSMGAGEGFGNVAEILLPYTINLHIKDFTIFRVSHKMGFIIEGRPAGKGMLDIADLVEKASSNGFCRSAVLELWTPPEADIETTIRKEERWVQESIDYLKTIIKD